MTTSPALRLMSAEIDETPASRLASVWRTPDEALADLRGERLAGVDAGDRDQA